MPILLTFTGILSTILHALRRSICRTDGTPLWAARPRRVSSGPLGPTSGYERVLAHREHFTSESPHSRVQ